MFYVVKHAILECYRVAFLHKNSSNSKVEGIHVDFEWLHVV